MEGESVPRVNRQVAAIARGPAGRGTCPGPRSAAGSRPRPARAVSSPPRRAGCPRPGPGASARSAGRLPGAEPVRTTRPRGGKRPPCCQRTGRRRNERRVLAGLTDIAAKALRKAPGRRYPSVALPSAAYPPGYMTRVHSRAHLGRCLTRTGQAAEGEPMLRTALADGAQADRSEFAHTFGNLETALGECLLAQKPNRCCWPAMTIWKSAWTRKRSDSKICSFFIRAPPGLE